MPAPLTELLDADECRALRCRARALLRKGCFPGDVIGPRLSLAAGVAWPKPGAYQPYLPATDMPRFLRELAEFVGLTDADAAAIRQSAPHVLAREAALTAALYEHFLKFPATARFFLGEDGKPDQTRIERRRHSLARWLQARPLRQRSRTSTPTTC